MNMKSSREIGDVKLVIRRRMERMAKLLLLITKMNLFTKNHMVSVPFFLKIPTNSNTIALNLMMVSM